MSADVSQSVCGYDQQILRGSIVRYPRIDPCTHNSVVFHMIYSIQWKILAKYMATDCRSNVCTHTHVPLECKVNLGG